MLLYWNEDAAGMMRLCGSFSSACGWQGGIKNGLSSYHTQTPSASIVSPNFSVATIKASCALSGFFKLLASQWSPCKKGRTWHLVWCLCAFSCPLLLWKEWQCIADLFLCVIWTPTGNLKLSDHYLWLKTGSLSLCSHDLSLTNWKCQLEKSGPVAAS